MKRKKLWVTIIVIVCAAVALGCIIVHLLKNAVISIATEAVIEEVFSDTEITTEDISEEDMSTLEDICSKYATTDVVTDVMEIADDEEAIEEYVYSILSDEELAQLEEIYNKYVSGE